MVRGAPLFAPTVPPPPPFVLFSRLLLQKKQKTSSLVFSTLKGEHTTFHTPSSLSLLPCAFVAQALVTSIRPT